MRTPLIVAFLLLLPGSGARGQAAEDSTVVLSLDRAVAVALENALPVRTSRLDLEVARAGVRLSSGAFDPILTLNPTWTRTDGRASTGQGTSSNVTGGAELSTVVSGTLPFSTRYSFVLDGQQRLEDPVSNQGFETEYDNTMSLTLTQPVLAGFGGASGLDQQRAAEDALSAAEERHRRQVEILIADVETAYQQLAQREAEEGVARESLDRAESILSRNEELRELERISGLDLLTSRSGVAARRNSLTIATQLRQNAADALISLIWGEAAPVQLDRLAGRLRTEGVTVEVPTLPSMATAEETALEVRADVVAARYDLARQERLLGTTENALLPTLDLSTTYTRLGSNTADFLQFGVDRPGDFASEGWSAGLSFSWPLGNRRARASAQTSRAIARQAGLFVSSAENFARIDVRAALRGVRFGQEAWEESLESLELAEELYQGEVERHRLGLTDSFRLLQVEDQVATAYQQEVAARFGLLGAITRFELAMGDILIPEYGAQGR